MKLSRLLWVQQRHRARTIKHWRQGERAKRLAAHFSAMMKRPMTFAQTAYSFGTPGGGQLRYLASHQVRFPEFVWKTDMRRMQKGMKPKIAMRTATTPLP